MFCIYIFEVLSEKHQNEKCIVKNLRLLFLSREYKKKKEKFVSVLMAKIIKLGLH